MVFDLQRGKRRDRKGIWYRCFLNGREVTRRTFYADSRRGIVRMYVTAEDGCFLVNAERTGPQWEEKRGRVRFVRKAA